jgi:recombination protein RecR
MYSPAIQNLINQFAKLPSVGPKTASRLVFYLLSKPRQELIQFGEALEHIQEKIKICSVCYDFGESDPCPICADVRRDRQVVCVVAKPQDIEALEKARIFEGTYHLLGGNIDPLAGVTSANIRLQELIDRVKSQAVKEVILALNPDMEGETTALYLVKLLKQFPDLKITRLARGLPMGADVEYADEVTLENALSNRQTV